MRTTPLTSVLAQAGGSFGLVDGWERLEYIKPETGFTETHSFRFNETFDVVAREVAQVHEGVGLTEVNGFNRLKIIGRDALAWLDTLVCGRVPAKVGRVGLAYLLNHHGNIKAEATLARLDDNTLWYGSAAASERHDRDWLEQHLPTDGSIKLESLTESWTTLVLAGPRSRNVLSDVSRGDWSAMAFPWLSVRRGFVGSANATIMAVSFSGELAYEIHVPTVQLQTAYSALRDAGVAHGLQLFGSRAVESMRIEKGFRHWKADLITEFDPFESSLDRFVKCDKSEFIGRDALLKKQVAGPRKCFVTLQIECDHAPAQPGDSLMSGDRVVGTVTSGDWGHRVKQNLCMGFVDPEQAKRGTRLQVEILGSPVAATVAPDCSFDPEFARIRM